MSTRSIKGVKRKAPTDPVLDVNEWDSKAEAAILGTLDNDDEISSSDEEKQGSPNASDQPLSETEIEEEEVIQKHEDEHISKLQKSENQNEQNEWSDPEYGYNSEDSENERTLHTIGDVPLHWYDEFEHIGYDLDGEKVARPKGEDAIDRFMALNESSSGWKSVYDEKSGKRVLISDRDMEYIKRLQKGESSSDRYDAENWFIPVATMNPSVMPIDGSLPPKSRFIPSKWEAQRIRKLAYLIRKGHIKLDQEEKKEEEPKFFLIWEQQELEETPYKMAPRVPPPKPRLPGHAESYNPPTEYLFDEEEHEEWKEADPSDRKLAFVPQKFGNLRSVPAWADFHKERFERCLDLYLCARQTKTRSKVDMEALAPQLPKPAELRPFPNTEMMIYLGHVGRVRSISMDCQGQWLVSGGEDKTVRLWEIQTTRCIKVWQFDEVVHQVSWNPNGSLSLIAVATPSQLILLTAPNATESQQQNTQKIFGDVSAISDAATDKIKSLVTWRRPSSTHWNNGFRLVIEYDKKSVGMDMKSVTWHYKGDYLATVSPSSKVCPVLIHQFSKRLTQAPFTKAKGEVQHVKFHPSKPFFFVANQRNIRIYNLVKQALVKKLQPKVQWISSIDVHPRGDNLIVGSYDKKVTWFDLDYSTKPYKTLRYHTHAVRSVKFHPRYPLFASGSDDGTIQVFHGTVYDDLMTNPLIVPLKILRGHETVDELGVLDIAFHPTQPWIFSAGADASIRLFVH